MTDLVDGAAVMRAASQVAAVIRPTPVEPSDTLSALCGRPVRLKPEHRQRTGSFKIRGATAMVAGLEPGAEVVAASAGNHAQGVAHAATAAGCPSVVFMPASASLPKVEATRGYGADVRFVEGTVDDAIAAAGEYAVEVGATYVPPFDHPAVIAGQGTVGSEIVDEAGDVDVVVVPVGGGGLLAGLAVAVKDRLPEVRVVGVEASAAASMGASVAAGRPVAAESVATIADGIAVRAPSELTLAHVAAYVDDIVTVTDDEIGAALVLLLERAKAVVEPAGAAGVAALLAGRVGGTGAAVAVLSGGNVDPLVLARLIEHGLSAAGRYVRLRVVLSDRPGRLAEVLAAFATHGLNVIDVEHRRAGVELAVGEAQVEVTVETRDPSHTAEVLAAVRAAGVRVTVVH